MKRTFVILNLLIIFFSISLDVKSKELPPFLGEMTFFDLKGKTVLIPSYNGGETFFPFVYQKECYFTGKNKKKMRVDVEFIGVPITIIDTQVLNEGKSSKKLCILFSNDGIEAAVVIPLCVNKITDDMNIFRTLFYYTRYPEHNYQNDHYWYLVDYIFVKCYDYMLLKSIEDKYLNKEIVKDYGPFKKGMIIKRFYFKANDGIDNLYIECHSETREMSFMISPIGENTKFYRDWDTHNYVIILKEIEDLFK